MNAPRGCPTPGACVGLAALDDRQKLERVVVAYQRWFGNPTDARYEAVMAAEDALPDAVRARLVEGWQEQRAALRARFTVSEEGP